MRPDRTTTHDPDRHIPHDATLRVSSEAVSTGVPGESVILDEASGKYFGLEGVGARVWELLQEGTTLPALLRTIVAEYEVDSTVLERDLRGLLAHMRRVGLVTLDDEAAG